VRHDSWGGRARGPD